MIKAGLFTCKELQLGRTVRNVPAQFLLSIWRAVQTTDFLHQVGSLLVVGLGWPDHLTALAGVFRGAGSARARVVGDRVVAVVAGLTVAGDSAVVLLLVSEHAVLQCEPPVTDITGVGSLPRVSPNVTPEILGGPELSVAEQADDLPVNVVRKLSSQGIVQLLATLGRLRRNLLRTVKGALLQQVLVFGAVVGF